MSFLLLDYSQRLCNYMKKLLSDTYKRLSHALRRLSEFEIFTNRRTMALNVQGLIAIIILYVLMLMLGLYAAYRKREQGHEQRSEIMIVARRDIGYVLGTLTMTATWVGGGVINGTAEGIYTPGGGLVWTFTPYVIGPGILAASFIMAKKMRASMYLTMLDPFQNKYGKYMGSLFYIPAVCGEMFYSASILSALGSTIAVIIGIDVKLAIIVSSCIAVFYTLLGGFYSVAYTDVAQLFCMLLGLYLALPFATTHPAVGSIIDTAYSIPPNATGWLGKWEWDRTASWLDFCCVWIFGALPWQAYYQRILSTESAETGFKLSVASSFLFTFLVVPPVIIGAAAVAADWNQTEYGLPTPYERGHAPYILPLVLQYLTPLPVAIVGLASICTAVMSSIDSTFLSASSMFMNNIYKKFIRTKGTDTEYLWCMRISIMIFGAGACVAAIMAKSVYGLLTLCVDLIYVVIFPQLISVVHFDVNTYGALPAFLFAFIVRFMSGEASFGVKPVIHWPGGDRFPMRSFIMCLSGFILLSVSYLTRFLFVKGYLEPKYDVFKCNLAYGGKSRENKRKIVLESISEEIKSSTIS